MEQDLWGARRIRNCHLKLPSEIAIRNCHQKSPPEITSVLASNRSLLGPDLQQSAETWFFWLTSLPAIYGRYFRLMFLAFISGWMFWMDISGGMFLSDISWRIHHISSPEFISNTTFASPGKSLPRGYTVPENVTLKCLFWRPSCDLAFYQRRYTEATSSHHHPILAVTLHAVSFMPH